MKLSPEEKNRFDNLSTSDQLKLEKIFSMMQAEKNKANDPKSAVIDKAGNTAKFAKGEMAENGEPKDYTEEIAEGATDFIPLNNEVANRIEGLLSIPLKKRFLDSALDLIQDLWEEDPFDAEDVITHLANEMMNMLDSWQEQGDRLAGMEENHAMQGIEAELESGEIGNMDALTEDSSVKDLLDKIRKHLENKFEDRYRKMEYDLYIDSLERDIKRGEFDGVESISMSDHEDDFVTYIDEKSQLEEDKSLREHFDRFMFKKYK
jgi:hypothetical protein